MTTITKNPLTNRHRHGTPPSRSSSTAKVKRAFSRYIKPLRALVHGNPPWEPMGERESEVFQQSGRRK